MTAYYNEFNPHAAQWLRNLIDAGHIAPGIVDERSVEDVYPSDLRGFTQCHFFAGIGVWSYALRAAGWPDERPIWTGSCPCQPFSAAGEGLGFADERHLWPAFGHLISQCKPSVIAGEQVASKDADTWIDLVQDDLEALGYAFGAIPFPSASVGAPHIRDRLYWLAHANHARSQRRLRMPERSAECAVGPRGVAGELADAQGERWDRGQGAPESNGRDRPEAGGPACEGLPGPVNGFWRAADWLACRDGKWRPVEPGAFPLVDGTPARVGRLHGYGNAINAQQARIFIECVKEMAA